jgi:catechol 2,3-dioxygenase-like lactoylglutathione lyase family enzyme
MKFRYSGLHHVAFATADMDATVKYWRDLLGLKLVLTIAGKEGKQYAFALSKEMLIYFFEWAEVKPVAPKRHGQPVEGPFLFDHLAIRLETKEELFRMQDCLVNAEKPVTDIVDHGYIYSIYTYDPNGVPLEFNTALPGFDLFTEPVLTDEAASDLVKAPAESELFGLTDDEFDQDRPIISGEDAKLFRR